ncbi:hypothetical protein N7463_003781 [Penicillium fimorum]|uniref:Secreted protein n=1 Tax=Penicillium fimorum TaxID=1882269 RepID=A0A9W9Y3A0_9EURO|nr:hypothetical protein N7463_003781 [Penicillium fimorum]
MVIIFVLMTLWFRQRTPAQKRKQKTRMHKKRLARWFFCDFVVTSTYETHAEKPCRRRLEGVVEHGNMVVTVLEKSRPWIG